MRRFVPAILVFLALVTLGFVFLGENSYERISEVRNAINQQKQRNGDLHERVDDLKREVYGLQNDPRTLEKAARNELGMARPNEQIYIFEKDKSPNK